MRFAHIACVVLLLAVQQSEGQLSSFFKKKSKKKGASPEASAAAPKAVEAAASAGGASKKADVAVAVTGSFKTLLSPPVVKGFNLHVRNALTREGHSIAMFAALTGGTKEPKAVTEALELKYKSVLKKVEFVPSYMTVTPCVVESKMQGVGRRSVMKSKLRQTVSKTETKNVLTHWKAIRRVYDTIVGFEDDRGQKFAWIIRIRPDLVFLTDVRLNGLGSSPYVPFGDMWVSGLQSCLNDHVFACPREQCRPYFSTLELWESKHCTGSANEEDPSAPMPLGDSGPPAAPYKLPSPPNGFGPMWLVVRRCALFASRFASRLSCLGGWVPLAEWSLV